MYVVDNFHPLQIPNVHAGRGRKGVLRKRLRSAQSYEVCVTFKKEYML